jgi:hypothetical protein
MAPLPMITKQLALFIRRAGERVLAVADREEREIANLTPNHKEGCRI